MTFVDLLLLLFRILNGIVVPLVFTLAFIAFLVGILQSFFSAEEAKRKKGRNFALSAAFGFALMIAIWGIVALVVNTFGFNSGARPEPPYFGGSAIIRWNPGNAPSTNGNTDGGGHLFPQYPGND